MNKKDEIGVIHGRFQPLHNNHMEDYVLPAVERCRHLIVGIANPDPTLTARHPANRKRAELSSNPFTYYDRMVMLRSTMIEKGMEESQLTIVPFPINKPELFKHYVPLDATFYITIYDDWGRYKRELLESLGLRVVVLFERDIAERGISATRIRELMANQGDWKCLVPAPVAAYVSQRRLDEKLGQPLS